MTEKITKENRQLVELNELIELAEKVSEKSVFFQRRISTFTRNIYYLVFIFFTCFVISMICTDLYQYEYIVRNIVYFVPSVMIGITSIVIIINSYLEVERCKKELLGEEVIMRQLLDMIHEQQKLIEYNNGLSLVEKAIVDMKLSRIRFSSAHF